MFEAFDAYIAVSVEKVTAVTFYCKSCIGGSSQTNITNTRAISRESLQNSLTRIKNKMHLCVKFFFGIESRDIQKRGNVWVEA